MSQIQVTSTYFWWREEIRPVAKGGIGARPTELSKCTFVPLWENCIASIICIFFCIFISERYQTSSIGTLSLQTSTKTDCRITLLLYLAINDQGNLHLTWKGAFADFPNCMRKKVFVSIPHSTISLLTSRLPFLSSHKVATMDIVAIRSVKEKFHSPNSWNLRKFR